MVVYEFNYNRSQWRDVFEDGIFKRQMYVKSKKLWKDKIVMTAGGVMNVSPAGKYKRMYLIDNGRWMWQRKSIHLIQEDNNAFQAFMASIDASLPAFKFWVKKLTELGTRHVGIMDVLILNKDVPETESTLIAHEYQTRMWDNATMRYSNEEVTEKRWEIAPLLVTAKWRKMKRCERVRCVNEYRNWCKENKSVNIFLPDNGRRIVDILIHRNDPNFIVTGWAHPRTGVTNRDIEWLRSVSDTGGVTNYDIQCYHDWLTMIEDRVTDVTDPYFRRQRDWREQHDRMTEERARLRDEEERVRNAELEAQREQRIAAFKERYAKYTDVLDEDGWHVYISNSYEVWKKRAHALRQCIIACEYYDKKDEVLIFVDKGGKPRYTCEVFLKDKHIGQFYGNESRDSKDLRPGNDVKEIVKRYIQMYL